MNHKDLYNLLKTVKKNIRCPQCGKEYDFSQIKIRGIAEFVVFLELNCQDHMPVLATVALNENGKKKKSKPIISITKDDVLATFNFFDRFQGGFDKIFSNK